MDMRLYSKWIILNRERDFQEKGNSVKCLLKFNFNTTRKNEE